MATASLLIDGAWQDAQAVLDTFRSFNPQTGEANSTAFPVIGWSDLDRMIAAGETAAGELASIEP